MYDPESLEDEPPILRDATQLRSPLRLARFRSRREAIQHADGSDVTHECSTCRATMVIGSSEPKEMTCYACFEYRLFVPLTFSAWRRWRAATAYKLRNAWRTVKREIGEVIR